ncbi:MAG: copper chaperone PCu(A)C [Burkholderiales bacterium]
MLRNRPRLALLVFLALATAAPLDGAAAVVAVNEPWLRPAAKGASTEAFMEITVSEAATLVDVRSPAAPKIALASGKARSGPPFALSLEAGQPLRMEARGTHLVLAGVTRALARGERVAFTLVLRYADRTTQEIPVDAEVRRRSPSQDHGVHRH